MGWLFDLQRVGHRDGDDAHSAAALAISPNPSAGRRSSSSGRY